uniref:hypothetical protein n=1 Tax=Rhodoblastus acidophilus TaxID=1074 RepID=UPI002224FE07
VLPSQTNAAPSKAEPDFTGGPKSQMRSDQTEIVFHSRGNPPFAWRISARFRFRGSRSDLAETV